MIKYFFRQYWRYIAMALALASVSYLLGACEVNAEEVYTITSRSWYYSNGNAIGNSSVQYFQDNIVSCQITECQTNGSLYWYATNNQSVVNYPTGTTSILINMIIMNEGANEVYTNYSTASYINYVTANTQLYMINNDNSLSACQITGNSEYNISYKCPRSTNNTGYKGFRMNYNFKTLTSGSHWNIGLSQYYIYSKIDNSDLESIIRQQADRIITSDETTRTQIIATLNSVASQIINNNNTNTQSIISKFNEMIEQNQVCYYVDKKNIEIENKYLGSNGQELNYNNYGITNYIKITNKAKIKVDISGRENMYTCFYNVNKSLINCYQQQTTETNGYIYTIPNGAIYFRSSINMNSNRPTYEICDTAQNITNQQNEQIIQGNNDINNSINDSSVDDPDSDLNDMNENEISNSVISDLLLLPINMFENIVSAIGGTCSSFPLGELFGTNLVLPCINIQNLIGSSLWNVIDILFCGIFVLSIRKKFVDIFENITSLKDRGNELE